MLRVIRTAVADPSQAADAEWYMDYRNADGSLSEMCGNGIRLFARHLVDEGLADPRGGIPIATRDGVKLLTVEGDRITADLGNPKVLGETMIAIGDRCWPARHVDMGNPHAVVFVDDLARGRAAARAARPRRGRLPPRASTWSSSYAAATGTWRCGSTSGGRGRPGRAGRVPVPRWSASALADGRSPGDDLAYRVDLPGGTLTVTWTAGDQVLLTGPAVVVARGTTSL